MKSDEIIISICCLAYNHENYIRKCLNGFIMQKTNFKYEVLVHDDASTDNTVQIIQEYEKKYPEIIKPIYQRENQYSKGISISREYQYPRALGKYIALCEGDDYWTDELKLQKQVDFLENNPEYSICVHQVTCHNCKTGIDSKFTDQFENKEYSIDEIVSGTGGKFATNSIVMLKNIPESMPDCFKAKGFGDFQLLIYGVIVGKCYYIADNMSVYNVQAQGSWSSKIRDNRQFYLDHLKELIGMLKRVNEYYEFKYNEVFSKAILQAEYTMYIFQGNLLKIHSPAYRNYYLNEKNRGSNPNLRCLKNKFPQLYRLYSKIFKKGQ